MILSTSVEFRGTPSFVNEVFFDKDEIDKWLLNNSTITHQEAKRKVWMNDTDT